jgi:multiple sugar transport system permease protein
MTFVDIDRATNSQVFVGLDSYVKVFSDPVYRLSLVHTLEFIGYGAVGHIGLGFLMALLLNSKLHPRVLRFSRSLILLPWVISSTVVAALTQLWAHPLISPIGKALKVLGWGGVFEPLGRPETALITLVIVNIWQYTPFYMLMILAGMQSVNEELIDAAKVDGANYIQQIRFITWPHVRVVVLTFLLYDLVANAAYFDLIWIATRGGPVRSTEVIATNLYRRAFKMLDWNEASVLALILILLSFTIAIVVMRRIRRTSYDTA